MANPGASLIIGIDVGMACTGVAYMIRNEGAEMPDPHVIQVWPGNSGATSDKAPTSICYSGNRITWGFLTQQEEDPQADVHDWFKIFFDEEELKKAQAKKPSEVPRSHADVKQYYRDYLSKLYPHIRKRLEDNVPSWNDAKIEFLFSVPTTWTKIGLVHDFKSLACRAGFGADSDLHEVEISLTEAEAAAVYTFNAQNAIYSDGNVILIVDAGGGTTDLALLKVEGKADGQPVLKPLDEVRGDEIGSVEIDLDFIDMVEQNLRLVAWQLGMTEQAIINTAQKMAREGFKSKKEEFGTEESWARPTKSIPIPGIAASVNLPAAHIQNGKMVLTNQQIQQFFDRQLRKMFERIDFQMDNMRKVAPNDRITHMVLSGGLGSSQYVKEKLKQRYEVQSPHIYAPNIRILSSSRPQLAVVKGLVQDRAQRLRTSTGYLGPRKCRQSLGVVANRVYNAVLHQDAQIHRDIDGIDYAKDQIYWFIKQGQTLDQEHVDHQFYRTFRQNQREPWTSRIVICNNRSEALPRNLSDDGVEVLWTMKSDLTGVPVSKFELKKKHWFQCWKDFETHYKATYKIRFLLKPANVDSELWFQNQLYGAAKGLEVTWEKGAYMAAPRESRNPDPDRYR